MTDPPRDHDSSSPQIPPTDSWAAGPTDNSTPSAGSAPSTASWSAPMQPPLAPGRQLGKYTLRRILGRGGMGIVYEAWDPLQKRSVALKTLQVADRAADGTLVERFMREARAAARLRHPGIVTILDVDEDQGRHFFTMEMVEGRSFEKCLRAPDAGLEFPLRRRAELLEQVAAALGHAHRAGVIHRDIKPSNILIASDGRARLTDFGLAGEAVSSDLERLTLAGVVLGTPQYVSPEQAMGGSRRATPASDVYSLGVVLFRAFTGRMPFEGEGSKAIEAAVKGDVPRPRDLNPHVSPALEAIVLKCLSKDPLDRYPNGDAVAADLRHFLDGRPVDALSPPKPRKAAGGPRRVVVVAASVVAALIVAALGVVAKLATHRPTPSEAARLPSSSPLPPLRQPVELGDPALNGGDPSKRADEARAAAELARRDAFAGRDPDAVAARLASARDSARSALRASPGLAAAHAAIAESALAEGDFPAALGEFRAAVRAAPGDSRARIGLAWSACWLSTLETVLDVYLDGRADTPRAQAYRKEAADALARVDPVALPVPERRVVEALLALARGNESALRAVADQAAKELRDDPEAATFLLLRGAAGIGTDRLQPWLQAATRWPKNPLACALSGLVNDLFNHPDISLPWFDTALRGAPKFAPAFLGRALCHQSLNSFRDARVAFAAAVEAWPSEAAPRALRALFFEAAGDTGPALSDDDAAVRLDPSHPCVFLHRGDLRARSGNWAGALADYDSASALQPGRPAIRDRRTIALLRLEDWRAGLAAVDEALAANSDDTVAWTRRAIAHSGLGDFEAALADCTRATDIDPKCADAWTQRATAQFRLEHWQDAIASLANLSTLQKPDAHVFFIRGSCRRHTGDLLGAESDVRASITQDDSSAATWLELARILDARHDPSGASSAAKRAMSAAPPDWPELPEAKRLGGR